MPLTTLKYNDNEQEHRSFADTLLLDAGFFQRAKSMRDYCSK